MHFTWEKFIKTEEKEKYFKDLQSFIKDRRENANVYPPEKDVFKAFENTKFESIKVLLLGQDPYHQKGQAHGLSFSVRPEIKLPKSLINIYNEIKASYPEAVHKNGCLEDWSKQGVFLLNSILTVEESKPKSHQKKGWEIFTSKAIKAVNENLSGVVFLSWGKDAHKLCKNVDTSKHMVIKTSHPSPLGFYRAGIDFEAFKGSSCFKKANEYLVSIGKEPINW